MSDSGNGTAARPGGATGRVRSALGRLPGAGAVARLATRGGRRERGAAELSVVVVAASLVAGVVFGQGLSRTALELGDGLTWLTDDPSGEIIQVNPATGALEKRVQIGEAGEDLEIAQYDGRLFVVNHTTGELMAFDLTSLLVSGQRRVGGDGAVTTLAHDDEVFLVDREESTISAIDPVTTDVVGRVWVSDAGLADAVIDDAGTLWALEDDGTLHALDWSSSAGELRSTDEQSVERSGEGSVLVAHDAGTTVFGPDSGIVAQVGLDDGDEVAADAPKLAGELHVPETSPPDLVPASAPDTSTVVLVRPDGLREVDVAAIECASPATPEVFGGLVYVPCAGAGKVVVLDPDGERAREDILTPGAEDPELVLDDDNLLINAPGADESVVVRPDGTLDSVTRRDPDVPVLDPGEVPSLDPGDLDDLMDEDPDSQTQLPGAGDPPPSGTPRQPGGPGGPGGPGDPGDPGNPENPENPPTPTNPSRPGDPDELQAPSGVQASAVGGGTVGLTWSHSGEVSATGFEIAVAGGAVLTSVGPDLRETQVTVTPGRPTAFTVTATTGSERATSAPSNTVSSNGAPGAPAGVGGAARYVAGSGTLTYEVTVTWGEAPANGSTITGYTVDLSGPATDSQTVAAGTRSAVFTYACSTAADPNCEPGAAWSATVRATSDLGVGAAGSTSGAKPAKPAPPAPPLPSAGANVVSAASGDATMEGFGSSTVQLNPPADWAGFSGTCGFVHSGNQGGDESGTIACNQGTIELQNNHPAYVRGDGMASFQHSIVITATNANGTVQSARYSWTVRQPMLCDGCQIP